MAEGNENIESRLAAYIDGELPDSDRIEIERYLASNAGHLQLINELRTQKAHLSSLPRETAPVEILDHLQSHLERQSLLEQVDDTVGSMRINRWPQWTAVAAMLLLTVGLGALVFSVLPDGAWNRESVTIALPSMGNVPVAPSVDDQDKSSEATLSAGGNVQLQENEIRDRVRNAITHNRQDRNGDENLKPGGSKDSVLGAGTMMATTAAKHTASDNQPLTLNNGSAIVVATDDPVITQNLLAGYLVQNGHEFQPVRADIVDAIPSLEARMTLSAGQSAELLSNGNFAQQQQAIRSVVQRVNKRENDPIATEQYLLVRNVTPDDAKRLNTVINSQRGMKQQARFYGNYDLYPENVQKQSVLKDEIAKLDETQDNAPLQADAVLSAASNMNAREQANTEQKIELVTVPEKAFTTLQAKVDSQTAEAEQTATSATITNEPAMQLTARNEGVMTGENIRTDILIVVRNDISANAAATHKPATNGAQPAAPPPSTLPSPSTIPTGQ